MNDILLLVQKCAHTFSFYDLESKAALAHIVLPNFPHEFAVDAHRRFAYVGIFGIETAWSRGHQGDHRIAVIDLHERTHARTLDLWPYYRPHGMATDAEGRLYAMSEADNLLLVFDHPTRQDVPNMAIPSGGIKTHLVTLTRDARTAYGVHLLSNTVTKFHPRDATVPALAVMPGPRPEGNALSSDERTLYVANRGDDTLVAIDTATMACGRRVKTRSDPNRIYRTQSVDGRDLLLLTNSGEQSISVFDAAHLEEVERVALPANPTALSFHPARRSAFVSFQDDFVRELDLDSLKFVSELRTLREPDASYVLANPG
ncbi:YncE family protein [Trinickia terrae]|uniref:YncE family protein n=1 Tax=Trinickia terrae TaxID=2571161 RepID=A0A4U1I4A5_9BURK|nr:YncE family protein [Trinickia terrae]TKC88027.1 YncE family protein [Trinickia terrae]